MTVTSGLITEYMKLLPVAKEYARLDKLANSIEAVSGYSLEKLLQLFMVGYTLKAPENVSMYTLLHEMDDEND